MWFQGLDDDNFFIDPDIIKAVIESEVPLIQEDDPDDYSNAPLYPSLALGFRSWRIYTETDIELIRNHIIYRNPIFGLFAEEFIPEKPNYLYPIVREEEHWKPGINYSKCHSNLTNHESPASNCHCGFNSFNNLKDAENYESFDFDFNRFVLGSIAGWGKLQLHETGWRSEFAKIIALLIPNLKKSNLNIEPHIKRIAEFYRVPVFESSERDTFIEYSKSQATQL